MCATDVDFAPDGSLVMSDWVDGWAQPGKGRLYGLTFPDMAGRPDLEETRALLAADLKAGASPASSEDAIDDLYNEIAAKNGVDLDERVLDDDANPDVMFQPPPVDPSTPPAAQTA